MTNQYTCELDGASLSGLDDRICILDIQEDAPKLRSSAFPLPGGGQHLTQARESLTVRVTFAIQEENPTQRKKAVQAVLAWAMQGGVLTVSDHPGQQLTVSCTALPAVTCEAWTEPLTIAFTTTHCPYWEDKSATVITGTGAQTLTVPGTAESTPVDATITNTGTEDVTRVIIQCGASCIIFEDILLPAGGKLILQVKDGLLTAHIYGEGILPNRTANSADLLLAPCGKACTVYATALQPLQATFSARGRYV